MFPLPQDLRSVEYRVYYLKHTTMLRTTGYLNYQACSLRRIPHRVSRGSAHHHSQETGSTAESDQAREARSCSDSCCGIDRSVRKSPMIPYREARSVPAVQRPEAQLRRLLGAASSADWLKGKLWMHKGHMAWDQIFPSKENEIIP